MTWTWGAVRHLGALVFLNLQIDVTSLKAKDENDQ